MNPDHTEDIALSVSERQRYTKATWILLGCLTAFRVVYLPLPGVVPQEAYYWMYTKHPGLSYFDHPPMMAYIIALFTAVGGDGAFFIRIGAALSILGAVIILFRLASKLFDERTGFYTLVIMCSTTLFSIGSTIMTPDPPLVLFWTLVMLCVWKATHSEGDGYWYLAGISLGAALLSKYTAGFAALSTVVYVLLAPRQRYWLKRKEPYLAVLLALLVFSPVILWNVRHDWASFSFQFARRAQGMLHFRIRFFGELIGSQLGMMTPVLLGLIVWGTWKATVTALRTHDETWLFLTSFSVPMMTFFVLISFRTLVKMNWMAPAYLSAMIATAQIIRDRIDGSARIRAVFKAGVILAIILLVIVHVLIAVPLIPLGEADSWTGWPELTDRLTKELKTMPSGSFVFSRGYGIASEVAYHSKRSLDTHAGNLFGERGLQYAYWSDIEALKGKNGLFVSGKSAKGLDKVKTYFERVEELEPLEIWRKGQRIRYFRIFRCTGYLGPRHSSP